MVNGAIHRVIEQQAAMQPDAVALVDGIHAVTYRELNQRANALARRLCDSGLKRGGVASVQMERSVELATVLLAVLKAGAAYAWREPGSCGHGDLPASFCITQTKSSSEECFRALDIRKALSACAARPSPNLPILTRGSDIACVLPDEDGRPHVLVPHETVASMRAAPRAGAWASEPGAFDLWLVLMSGATVKIEDRESGIGSEGSAIGDQRTVPVTPQAA